MKTSVAVALVVLLGCAADVAAQLPGNGRLVLEPVAAVNTSSDLPDDPYVFLDFTATVRLASGLDVIARPWQRRLPGGDWSTEMYQLQIRYQTPTRLPVRIDGGIITSPLGLATLQLRPDQNATVSAPFYYFVPLPSFDGYRDGVVLMSGGYPLGVVASSSGTRWDARVGVLDGTVTRTRKIFHDGPAAAAQVIGGGGFTLAPGVRIGAAVANGRYRSEEDLATLPSQPVTAGPARPASVFTLNVEGEAAVGHTTLNGEWIRNRFETAGDPAVARGFRVEGTQALTARVFAAGRAARLSSPIFKAGVRTRVSMSRIEATLGYRLTPDVTLRGGYETTQPYGTTNWNHAAVTSVVFSRRFF